MPLRLAIIFCNNRHKTSVFQSINRSIFSVFDDIAFWRSTVVYTLFCSLPVSLVCTDFSPLLPDFTSNQCVTSSPFPLATTFSSRNVNQWLKTYTSKNVSYSYFPLNKRRMLFLKTVTYLLPPVCKQFAVDCDTWILFFIPVCSMRAAVFIVSPNN